MVDIYMSLDDLRRLNISITQLRNDITEVRVPIMTNMGLSTIVLTNRGGTISSHPDFFTTAHWTGEDSEVSISGVFSDSISMTGYYDFIRENSFGEFGEDEPPQKPSLKQLLEEQE